MILEYCKETGSMVSIEGKHPHLLIDPGFVWLVAEGQVSVSLAALTEDHLVEETRFLFEASSGDLLFGMAPYRDISGVHYGLMASGMAGTTLWQLSVEAFNKWLNEQQKEEGILKTGLWLEMLGKNSEQEAPLPQEYLSQRDSYHHDVLSYFVAIWEQEKEEEKNRLQKKQKQDQLMMEGSLAKLIAINRREASIQLEQESGDILLDTCRLIGKAMDLDVVMPSMEVVKNTDSLQLDEIAGASRFRTREVVLQENWFQEDCGPILGFMKDDNRPVALLPVSVNKYMIHDMAKKTQTVADKHTASAIGKYGFIFYRPFDHKSIGIKDLLLSGFKGCWKRDLVIIMLMGLLGGLLGTAIPIATGIIFSQIIPAGEKAQLLQIAFFLGASALASMLFQFTRAMATLRIEGKMDSSIQAAVWDRLLGLPVPFFKDFSAGDLAMRAMGINHIRMILSGVTLNSILTSIFSVFTFALLFYYDARMAGTAAVLVFFSVAVMAFLGYRQIMYERQVLEITNTISGLLLQLVGGINKFRAAGAESRAFNKWAQEYGHQRELTFKKETLGNLLATFNAFFPVVSTMIIFYTLSTSSDLSPGQFIAFNAAFISFMFSMVSLSDSVIKANIVIPLYQLAKPILETLPEYDQNKITPKKLTGAIEVSHLSFRYKPDGPLILKDISFQVEEGDYVALVGTSGCGKSTLFRVLLGFEKPETGKIYYNGQDLSKIDVRAVRRQLGVVLQNGQLLHGTIFNNIVGANYNLNQEDAWEAARMAGVDQDIKEMPMGMHTIIAEGAGTISGGQKQRLMIARAIVNKPKIIYFDEATSALDNRTQAIVSKSLEELNSTRIVIAHRLSTIINCNKIIVMDKGQIVETGNYQELMEKDGVFAELARRQTV